MNAPKTVNEHHSDMVKSIGLPSWMFALKCPFCKEQLGKASIRAIVFKTNARNIGDLCIDFVCCACKQGDYIYFRKLFKTSADMNAIVDGKSVPSEEPILEEAMYSLQYNNVVEDMLKEKQNEHD